MNQFCSLVIPTKAGIQKWMPAFFGSFLLLATIALVWFALRQLG